MKIVRRKDFEIFAEGRDELLSFILPNYTPLYEQLTKTKSYEDTFSILQRNNIYLDISRNSKNGFTFSLIFEVNSNGYIQTLLNQRRWELVEDECVGLSEYDKVKILNNLW